MRLSRVFQMCPLEDSGAIPGPMPRKPPIADAQGGGILTRRPNLLNCPVSTRRRSVSPSSLQIKLHLSSLAAVGEGPPTLRPVNDISYDVIHWAATAPPPPFAHAPDTSSSRTHANIQPGVHDYTEYTALTGSYFQ
ncbi:unnamed protein product [Pleuronectes platessa]|uniref:Uncharacterized protein n=1 Tax=Pleuronectes platessa TaxID=8262 RepID=A0A9N7VCI7_PLEPL|nr:unnamed protein product [Pleuronectes platessa]